MNVSIYPNLDQAREEGFEELVGHPPFPVNFGAEVEGEAESYSWDFDGDGEADSDAADPRPFVYEEPGEYTASVSVRSGRGEEAAASQRIVVVGEPDRPDWRFGVAAHLNESPEMYDGRGEVERAAREIQRLDLDAVRLDLRWSDIQPDNRDEYEWEDYDSLVRLSEEYGFDLLPIIDYSAEWSSTAGDNADTEEWLFTPPEPAEYAWFTYKTVDRYKDEVPAWEIWNEPNHGNFWRPRPDPREYTELLKQAYLSAKYADPETTVVLGGLTYGGESYVPPERFLRVVYRRGGGSYFDVLGSHPYTDPDQGTDTLRERVKDVRDVMVANDDGRKPIWLTEYGYPPVPATSDTYREQGAWLTESLDTALDVDYVESLFWYNLRDKGNDPDEPEDNYGLIQRNWKPKPAYEAYEEYIEDERGN